MFSVMPVTKKGNGREFFRSAYPLSRLGDEFDALFNRFFAGWPVPSARPFSPEMYWGFDMDETEKEYIFCFEAPGFEAKDFDLHVTGDVLTVCADHKQATGEKGAEEYGYGERHFKRSVNLPGGIVPNAIEAIYKNGILEIHMPKSETAKSRQIAVKS
jgi:HSP20 family protein